MATNSSARSTNANKDSTKIDVLVRDDRLNYRKYECIRTKSLKDIFDSFYAAHKKHVRGFIYMYDGKRLTNQDTPVTIQMDKGGWIDAISVPRATGDAKTGKLDPATQSEFDERSLAAKQNVNIKVEYGTGEPLNIWHPRKEPMTNLVKDIAKRMGYSDNQNAILLVYLDKKQIDPKNSPVACGVGEGTQIDIYPYARGG